MVFSHVRRPTLMQTCDTADRVNRGGVAVRYRPTSSATSQRSPASERVHVTRVTQDNEGQTLSGYLIFSLNDVLRDKNIELLNLAPNPNPAPRAAPHHDSFVSYHAFLLLGAT
jgi:hypothetical protein